MSGSFSVDVEALGDIPRQLSAVRASVGAIRVGQLGSAAARAAGPGFGGGIERLGVAVDAFAAAGAAAIDLDVATLTAAAAAYQRNEHGIVRSTTAIDAQRRR